MSASYLAWIPRSVYCKEGTSAFVCDTDQLAVLCADHFEFISFPEPILATSQILKNNLFVITYSHLFYMRLSEPSSAVQYNVPESWSIKRIENLHILEGEYQDNLKFNAFLIITRDNVYKVISEGKMLKLQSLNSQFSPYGLLTTSPYNQALLYSTPAGLICHSANGGQRVISEGVGYWIKRDFAITFTPGSKSTSPKFKVIQATKDEKIGKTVFKEKAAFELVFDLSKVLAIEEKCIIMTDCAGRLCVHPIKNLLNKAPQVNSL